jgi:hypothetical protein
MRDRIWWLGVVLGLALAGQSFAMEYQEVGPLRPLEGTISFSLYRGYLIVARGSAGTLKGLTFLVDTGASPSVLDSGLARRLHLRRLPASVAVLGGSVQAERAFVPSLNFGPMQSDNVPVLVEDLSFLQKVIPVRVDGVIGLDVLGQSAFMIDYGARQIHFGPLPALPDPIPMHMAGGLAVLDGEVNDLPAHLLLDTGAASLLLFAPSMPGTALKLRSLRLGTEEFGKEPAFVIPDGSHGGHAFDGLISPAGLGMRRVAIDLERGEVAFSR